jgi:hypothetical protein
MNQLGEIVRDSLAQTLGIEPGRRKSVRAHLQEVVKTRFIFGRDFANKSRRHDVPFLRALQEIPRVHGLVYPSVLMKAKAEDSNRLSKPDRISPMVAAPCASASGD